MPTPLRVSDYLVFDGAQIGRAWAQNYLTKKEFDRRTSEDTQMAEDRRLSRELTASEGRLNRENSALLEGNRFDREDLRQQSYLDRVLEQQEGMNLRNDKDIASKEKIAGAQAASKIGKSIMDWLGGKGAGSRGDGLGGDRLDESKKVHRNTAIKAAYESDDERKSKNKLIVDADGNYIEVPRIDPVVTPNAGPSNVRRYTFDPNGGLIPEGSGEPPLDYRRDLLKALGVEPQ